MEYTKGPNTVTLARGDSKKLKFPIHGKDPEKVCGNVVIDVEVPTDEEKTTKISLSWEPDKDAKCDLCPPDGAGWIQQGWIQHVTLAGEWHYDNNAVGSGQGAASDPAKDPQPVTPPQGGGHWRENPWYGGGGNETSKFPADKHDEESKKFAKDPKPQSSIDDSPSANVPLGFTDQLVCVTTGKVIFTYRWIQDRTREGVVTFIGGEDLTIDPSK